MHQYPVPYGRLFSVTEKLTLVWHTKPQCARVKEHLYI